MKKSYFLCPLCGSRLVESLDPYYGGFRCEKCGFSNEYEHGVPIRVPSIYYIDETQGNIQCGPVSPLDVAITPDTYVWMENMKDWTQARNVHELYPFFRCPKKKFTYQTEVASSPEMAMLTIENQCKDERLVYRAVANPSKHKKIVYACVLIVIVSALILGMLSGPDILSGLLKGVLISVPGTAVMLLAFGEDIRERDDHRLDSVFITNECIRVIVENKWHCLALDYIGIVVKRHFNS